MSRVDTGVVIAGGGPAGSILGLRLAELGHRVQLFEKREAPGDHPGESLPPSIVPLLDFTGLTGAVDEAMFPRTRGAWIRWDGSGDFRESPAAGYQVSRTRFDAILLDAARARGVDVRTKQAFDSHRTGARIVVDATGRRGITGGKRHRMGAPTLASYAYWRDSDWSDDCSRVEALDSGWIWAAPLGGGTSIIAAFTDPQEYGSYDRLISESVLLPRSGTRGPVQTRDATAWLSETIATPDLVRTGEAAFAIDPLSSQGVQTAIASALQAAVTVNTILRRPEHAGLALAFYESRQRAAAIRHASIAANLYAEAARSRPGAFWRARASVPRWPEPAPPSARIEGDFVVPR